MMRKVLALLGAIDENDVNVNDVADDGGNCEDLFEFEEGDWVIINIHEGPTMALPEVDPLENMLIEHPSMSVYQLRCQRSEDDLGSEEEEEEEEEDDDGDSPRPVPLMRSIPWRMTAWGDILECDNHFQTVQRSRVRAERRKLTHSALCRQSLVRMRFCPSVKRYGYFKQPSQRLYNY